MMDTDRNLLFGVLALQADLLTANRFAEACSAWAGRKGTPLADLLVERGWLTPAERADVDKLLERKLKKHQGNAKAGLAEAATPDVRQSLAGDTPAATPDVVVPTSNYVPEAGERYTLSRLHASGGIGRVWLAHDSSLGRDVALKEVRPERVGHPTIRARFLKEAWITGQLEHPGVVPIYELGCGTDERGPFYTMRFVRGRTLAEAVAAYHRNRAERRAGPLELRELLTAFQGVCNAVAYAHSRGVLHRDLKPQNVVLGGYGEAIVLDWGLARVQGRPDADAAPVVAPDDTDPEATVQGQVLGTPAYMAPEQAEGRLDLLDARSDVYGLGAVLYEVLCGKPPFGGPNTTAVLRRVVHEAPASPRSIVPGTPRALEAVCLKALAKKPAERYGSAKELAHEVERWLADEPVAAYRDPMATRLTRWGRRHRTLAAALAVAVLAVLGGLGAVLAVQTRAKAELAAKNQELAEQQAEVEARFETAQKAIATFHTGVSEDVLLKNANLKELRTKLLKEAAGFYGDLEKLLAGKTDAKSRKLLAESTYQLGELTEKIGDRKQALAVQQQGLALWRELASAAVADVDARVKLARSVHAVGWLLLETGDPAGALAALREQRDVALALEAEAPTDAGRSQLVQAHSGIGVALERTGKPAEALEAHEKALAIQQKLVEANPAVLRYRQELAKNHLNIGVVLEHMSKPAEALAAYEKALAIHKKVADADPSSTQYQADVARCHHFIGTELYQQGKPAEALAAYEKGRAIREKLAGANAAVIQFQQELAGSYNNIAVMLGDLGKPAESLAAHGKALAIRQKLAEANPAVILLQADLGRSYFNMGAMLATLDKPADSLTATERSLEIRQKLVDANATFPQFQRDLTLSYTNKGDLLDQMGKTAEALPPYEKAQEILRKLVKANPAVPEYRRDLARSEYCVGRFLTRLGRAAEGFAALDRGQAMCQELVDAYPAIAEYRARLCSSHAARGAAHARAGHAAGAAADLRRAVELWAKVANLDADDHFERSRALALLAALAGDAKSGVSAAEAPAFADQAVAALRDAVKAGWRQRRELKEPDFDALRTREDFRKLQKELEG
jgi:serine/threonine-protein kinase